MMASRYLLGLLCAVASMAQTDQPKMLGKSAAWRVMLPAVLLFAGTTIYIDRSSQGGSRFRPMARGVLRRRI